MNPITHTPTLKPAHRVYWERKTEVFFQFCLCYTIIVFVSLLLVYVCLCLCCIANQKQCKKRWWRKKEKKQRYTVCRFDFSFLLFIFVCVYAFNRACDCIRVQHTFNIFYPQLIFFCWAHTFNQSGKKKEYFVLFHRLE